jgi:two-component system, NarL family, nitrate/nitrite response regulator NarL
MQIHANLLIVADHPLYIEGFQSMLARRAPSLRCTAARTPAQATERLRAANSLALVIADYQLAGPINGLSLLQQIGARRPALPRVLMTNGEDAGLSLQARRAGLAGCVSKSMEPADWVQALEVILSGGYCFAAPAQACSTLNERQITVLQLASVGLGTRQIAHKLHLTERTVKYHLSESFRRLATSTRTEAVAKAAALGLINLSAHQSLSA